MTNAQHYWPEFCRAIDRPELEDDPKFATFDNRQQHAAELVEMIDRPLGFQAGERRCRVAETHQDDRHSGRLRGLTSLSPTKRTREPPPASLIVPFR